MNTAPAEAIFDRETIEDLTSVFGHERLMVLLAGLQREIAQRLSPASSDRECLSRDAHALVSVSGALGFLPLSRACTDLERACLTGGDHAAALHAVLVAAAEAERGIAWLRAR